MLRSAQGVTFLPDSPRLLIFIFDAFAPFDAFLLPLFGFNAEGRLRVKASSLGCTQAVQGFVFSWDRFHRRACLGNQGLGEENS